MELRGEQEGVGQSRRVYGVRPAPRRVVVHPTVLLPRRAPSPGPCDGRDEQHLEPLPRPSSPVQPVGFRDSKSYSRVTLVTEQVTLVLHLEYKVKQGRVTKSTI